MRHPLEKIFITQRFGENPEIYKQFDINGHNGIDYRTAFKGDTPKGRRYVYAAKWGKVIEVGDQGDKGYGVFVRIQHFKDEQTIYAHLTKAYVKEGDAVETSQLIGLSGNTGFSSGAHLHFGFRPYNWKELIDNGFKGYVNPIQYLQEMESKEVEKPVCNHSCPVHCPAK